MALGEIAMATAAEEAIAIEARPSRPLSLRASTAGPAPDRRLEEWIAGCLDGESDRLEADLWTQLVGGPPAAQPPRRRATERHDRPRGAWGRFCVVYRRGVAVVRLTDRALVKQSEIRELADDLADLIAVGNQRIVLNFSRVERLGSWIVAAAVEGHRRCEAVEGGRLKVCGLTREFAEVFQIIGVGRRINLCDHEDAAIDGPWPAVPGPRPLPIDVLEALVQASTPPPIQGGAPIEELRPRASESRPPSEAGLRPTAGRVWLGIRHGGGDGDGGGRVIPAPADSFVVGRDQAAELRLSSPQVSKRHATFEIRGGRVFLRDLGSTNGTLVNGEPLRDAEVELHSEDKIRFGPIRCKIWIGLTRDDLEFIGAIAPASPIADRPAGAPPTAADRTGDPFPTELPTADEPSPLAGRADRVVDDGEDAAIRIKAEVLQDVLVVTPVVTDLDGEDANEALRLKLHELSEQPLPRRVVVDLEFVGRLNRRTIGVLLAHHLRLDRVGGGVRLCEAHPRITALLDQVRLTMMVDCFTSLDEAVLAAWTDHAPTAAADV